MGKNILKTKEVTIAIFAIVALFLLIWGVNFLRGINIFKKQNTYYAIFEKTDGLMPAHSVVVNGMVVGNVDNINLLPEQGNKILVAIKVNKEIQIPTNSQIKIVSPSPLSSPQVELLFGDEKTYFQYGDTLIGNVNAGLLDGVDVLIANLTSISYSLDTIANSLKTTIATGTLDNTLRNIEAISDKIEYILAQNQGKIDNVMSNIDTFSQTLSKNEEKINNIITDLNKISSQLAEAQLKETIDNASMAIAKLDTLIAGVNAGDGTLGQLVTNDSLYISLKNTLTSLDALLVDLKAKPKKYINVTVFGKREKKDKTK